MSLPKPTPTLTTIAAQLAQAQSILGAWLNELEQAPRAPEFFAQNIQSLNQATGLLYRLTAIEKTLAALRYRDSGDLRMLNEMNFLLDKIQRLYNDRPIATPRQALQAAPLPALPVSLPGIANPSPVRDECLQPPTSVGGIVAPQGATIGGKAAASAAQAAPHPFGPQATCLNFELTPPAPIAEAIAQNPQSAPQPVPRNPQPGAIIANRSSLLSTIRACRCQSGWRDEALRPQLLQYFCDVLNHFCTRMDDRINNRPDSPPASDTSISSTQCIPSIMSMTSIPPPQPDHKVVKSVDGIDYIGPPPP